MGRRIIGVLLIFILSIMLCSCKEKTLYDTNPLLAKLSTGRSINILINGDSIAADSADFAWQNLVAQKLKVKYQIQDVFLSNISLPGNASYGGYAIENLSVAENDEKYDLIILCYGQNDYEYSKFPIYYEALIRSTKKNNPCAEIITILESAQTEYTENIKNIIEISDYYGISYVDTIKAFKESGFSNEELTIDLVHLNEKGHEVYADSIWNTLQDKVLMPEHEQAKLKKPLNKEVENFEHFYYIDKNQMTASNDGLSFFVDGTIETLGIDQLHEPGNNKLMVTIGNETLDLSYEWNYSFSQRHISLIQSEYIKESKQTKIIIQGDEKNLNLINGIIITGKKEIPIESQEVAVKLQWVDVKSIKSCQILNQTVLNAKSEVASVESGYTEAANYYISVYPVKEDQFLEVSSNTIGTVNSITRYAFYADNMGKYLVKKGSYNTGGWTDKYSSHLKVPAGAKYLFVSSQNNSDIIVKENIQKNICEEIPFETIFYNKTITSERIMCGSEINQEYGNYSVYLYKLEGRGRAIVNTSAVGNPNTFMIFALSDKKDGSEFEKTGVLNAEGWNETPETWVYFSEKDKFLYVVCQNASVPTVTIESELP